MKKLLSAACLMMLAFATNAQRVTISVDANHPDHEVSPTLFGLFLEDINLSVDGGLYRELIRNRSFEDADTLCFWTVGGKAELINTNKPGRGPQVPLNFNNKQYLRVGDKFSLSNSGYWGISLVKGETYDFRIALRTEGNVAYDQPVSVRLVDSNNNTLASGSISDLQNVWTYSTLTFAPSADCHNAHLEIAGQGKGQLSIDMVSLMPRSSWGKSEVRKDLGEALVAMQPTFFRFPGGCWVEGNRLAERYQWKQTVGPIDSRVPLWNIWGYKATHGIGYHEYLQLAEDLGAEPLFCINAGVAHADNVGYELLDQWIQDALDAIEYANGPVTSVWGAARARNGHPKPFGLKYLEIGNENFGSVYFDNYERIAKAVLAKYPDMQLVSNDWSGSHPMSPVPALIDEHYYDNPDWFILNASRYDKQPRSATKIFIGEYAVTSGTGKGNLRGAVGEAAFMTGLERNSNHVTMAAYAPLFCNANHKRWPINLINFDNHRWYGLPSYYVQQMFAANQGTDNLPIEVKGGPSVQIPSTAGGIGLGTWKNSAEFKDLKVTTPRGKVLYNGNLSADFERWEKVGQGNWSVQEGVLRQSSFATGVTAFYGDANWTDYVITVKARKIEGENGFQIFFHHKQGVNNRLRWDIGGYSNSVNEMKTFIGSESIPYQVETGRWYDIRLEVSPLAVRGYIDGKLVQEFTSDRLNTKAVCASSAFDKKSGDIIVKVVNTAAKAVPATIQVNHSKRLNGKVDALVLTSANATDENTLDEPQKVAPKQYQADVKNNQISQTLPGNSVTIFRIHP